jgi:hypothetical protein
LKILKPTPFDNHHKHLPDSARNENEKGNGRHEYFAIIESLPWYTPIVEVRGRKYEIPPDSDSNWGKVIVDDEKNVVYIEVGHN